ncbi:MAG: pilus assembly protein TadG-related protein [Acidobacteria bacterium]|nr:pilus assembly protein TadG-related protein [Acidobacteriota bacterium]
MKRDFRERKGQALIMVTLASFALCGVMGLAVDLGWSQFVRKSAQTAADAAAMAAAHAALVDIGQGSLPACGVNVACQDPAPCATPVSNPPQTALDHGCLYAQQNGFQVNGVSGRQNVMVAGGTTSPPPTVPGVASDYWVTATVSEVVPQLFASLMSRNGMVAARATAAIVQMSIYGSLILLNHEQDCLPMESPTKNTCGVNLLVSANDNQGQYALKADGGIYLGSQKDGRSSDGRYAGENTGGGTIRAPFTYIRGSGSYKLSGSSTWSQTPTNGALNNYFDDPMAGKGQPKAPAGLTDRPVSGGTIVGSSDPANPRLMPAGNYFATATDSNGVAYATGDPLDISGYVRFGGDASGFSSFVFFGGVRISHQGTTVTFEPGMYVVAGVKSGALFSMTSNASLTDLTTGTGQNTDAGEIFIFTDTNYRGQGQALQIPTLVQPIASQLKQGTVGFQAGNNSSAAINLHGLNNGSPALPPQLKAFAPVLMWQDQANSVLKYDDNGYIDTSCGNPDGCPNTALASAQSAQLILQGAPTVNYYGTVYQPRGAWTTVIGGGDYNVPVQLIAGAMRIQGNASFSMIQPVGPISRRMVALVE